MQWAEQWSQEKINAGRAHDRWVKERYYSGVEKVDDITMPTHELKTPQSAPVKKSFWGRLRKFWQ